MPTKALLGEAATRRGLAEAIDETRPALLYTASHGLGVPAGDLELQKRLNGALCCQEEPGARYDLTSLQLTNLFDRLKAGRLTETPDFHERLASSFIFRSDAQNYMVLGDPAARLRLPA